LHAVEKMLSLEFPSHMTIPVFLSRYFRRPQQALNPVF
jgi:hypothetical protein